MIYAIGLDSDDTFRHFLRCALAFGVQVRPINLREVVKRGRWRLALPDDGMSFLGLGSDTVGLDPTASYYWRPIDLASVQRYEGDALRWRGLILGLGAWLELIPGIVANRLGASGDNGTKPLHERELSSLGFNVPPSLTSADAGRLANFASAAPTVVKAVSGVRANTRLVTGEELSELRPEAGPLHLQRYISGVDVRAHVVGDAVFAEMIVAPVVDYRSSADDSTTTFEPHNLPSHLERRVVAATARFGLIFAGWDLSWTRTASIGAWKPIQCPATMVMTIALVGR